MRVGKVNPTICVDDRHMQLRYVIVEMPGHVWLSYPCRALYAIDNRLDALRLTTYQTLMCNASR